MMDNLTPEIRTETMRRVKAKNTGPELVVRRLVHSLGYRYRLHRDDLPGCPDLVFPSRRAVLFVHGCFWHVHTCKQGRKAPKSNVSYWRAKRERNKSRDHRVQRQLRRKGWRVLVVWECQTHASRLDRLAGRITRFFDH
ncbi:MAG: DNA mismatch endonuclease Vsr [Phycisphaerae bacterium]|nr:DNA mismatch endonuclease Vsr [Phycisphaerae bacterium]